MPKAPEAASAGWQRRSGAPERGSRRGRKVVRLGETLEPPWGFEPQTYALRGSPEGDGSPWIALIALPGGLWLTVSSRLAPAMRGQDGDMTKVRAAVASLDRRRLRVAAKASADLSAWATLAWRITV